MTVETDKVVPIRKSRAKQKPGAPQPDSETGIDVPEDEIELRNVEIVIDRIDEGDNPRTSTESARDKELLDSVKSVGILQPIRVRPKGEGRYQVIAGHRRLAAAKKAKLDKIPAMIAMSSDDQVAIESLVENLQREDLNPMDEARAIHRLIDTHKLTQDGLAKRIGRSQPFISNSLRMLNLAAPVQQALEDGKITQSHAKSMVTLPQDRQVALAERVSETKVSSKDLDYMLQQERENERREKADAKRRDEAKASLIAAVQEAINEKKLPKTATVVTRQGADTDTLTEAFPKLTIVPFSYELHHDKTEGFDCSCKALKLEWTNEFSPICIVPDHYTEFTKARDAEKKKAAKERGKKITAFRRDVKNGIAASDTELNEDGIRFLMYSLYLKNTRAGNSLIKANGGSYDSYGYQVDGNELWQAVLKTDVKDHVNALLDSIVLTVVPNVYGEPYNLMGGISIRTYIHETLGVSDEIIRGGRTDEEWNGPRSALQRDGDEVEFEDGHTDLDEEADAQDYVDPDVAEEMAAQDAAEREAAFADGDDDDPTTAHDHGPDAEQALPTNGEVKSTVVGEARDGGPLTGETVIVTGVVEGLKRWEVDAVVNENGGVVGNAVNSNTTLLVVGERPGEAKLTKADELGIRRITEAEFRSMVGRA